MIELKVIFKGEDKQSYRKSFVLHEACQLSQDDPVIQAYVKEAREAISWVPEDKEVIAKLVWV